LTVPAARLTDTSLAGFNGELVLGAPSENALLLSWLFVERQVMLVSW
jgi:hypothetical protein